MNDVASIAPLHVNPHLRAIMDEEYPRFSDTEYERRHELLGEVMAKPMSIICLSSRISAPATPHSGSPAGPVRWKRS